ncbi:FUSC family protein [Saccharopolyspora rosea]|uniref:FUSC family protein n=1 Tax=Saccharopolyspora rosea TaxID=524884 RepID=A0ABW3FS01_9PSEU
MNKLSSLRRDVLRRLRCTLRTRDALRITANVGGVAVPALRAGASFGLPMGLLTAFGRLDLVSFAALGAFTSLYCRVDTYARRARLLPVIAAGLVASVAAGAATAAADHHGLGKVVVVALVAALAKLLSDALAFGAPAGLMFVFAAGAAAYAPQDWSAVGPHVAVTAASALFSLALAMSGALLHPTGPQRVAVARALAAVADHLDSRTPPTRHRAHSAVHRAHAALRARTHRRTPVRLRGHLAHAEALLHHPSDEAAELRRLAGQVRRGPVPVPEHAPAPLGTGDRRRPTFPAHLLPTAARMAVASLLAGVITAALHLDHPYWAVVSASSVLQSTNATATWHRAVQRMCGTLAGAVLALLVFGLHPSAVTIVALVVVCQVAAEFVVQANYSLGLIFATPVALGLASLAHPAGFGLVGERVGTTVFGALVGTITSLLLINRRSAPRLDSALTECRRAQQALRTAASSDVDATRRRLVRSVFALRDAHTDAQGELWHRDHRTREVLDVEHAAYELLAATARTPTHDGAPGR